MRTTFNIDYRTKWGESLYLTGNIPALGNGDVLNAVKMNLEGVEKWTVTVDIPEGSSFAYGYIVRNDDGSVRKEWGQWRHMTLPRSQRLVVVNDRWQDQPWDKPYYASSFTECTNRRPTPLDELPVLRSGTVQLRVSAPMIAPGQSVAVSGSSAAMGGWDVTKAVKMSDANFPEWQVNLPAKGIHEGDEFKFVIIDTATGKLVSYEGGDNRRIPTEPLASEITVYAGMRLINPLAPWRGAGTAIPVFSLRSDEDFGVGDFFDLKPFIDWAAKTGQTFVQLLPVNDTTMTHTWTDSYPYNANSIFALHPMYLRLEELGELPADRRSHYEALRKELNALPEIDYERVNIAKAEYCREAFDLHGDKTLLTDDYKKFVADNSSWLMPYAAFCVLRDRNNTPTFANWGEYAVYDSARVEAFIAENRKDIDFVCWQQYHLDRQMRQVRDYAHSHGVALKGDIPIGISRDSVDAWVNPELFNLDSQAGAPPDDFSVLGQNWGFPTYNWDAMAADGYAWWKGRFRHMARYFDAYRIDHVLGFFRIWQIPLDAIHGLLGIFNPALPFTAEEMRHDYDFYIDPDLHATPLILDSFINDFFGPYTDEARDTFMHSVGNGRYKLNEGFTTQRAVADYFATLPENEKNNRMRDALLGLIDNVLFIADPKRPGHYHPRISAQFAPAYNTLNPYERWCFDRLYTDFFYHRHNAFWHDTAMKRLPPLTDSTSMLVCAEDLGMIPACVPEVMDSLEILSLEIQRMPKDPGAEFGNTWNYPYRSVCTTSTHDMTGLRGWWEEDPAASQRYYNNVLHLSGSAPYFAEPWICSRIVDMHLKSPSMLCILPLQDWLSIDADLRRHDPREERINVPANSRHYWRYRMHLTTERLLEASEFNSMLQSMIEGSGRKPASL